MSTPPVPPRPSRSSQKAPAPDSASLTDSTNIPKIPPRPKRGIERSVSPHRDTFARSPLNELPAPGSQHPSLHKDNLSVDVPRRPPSVVLPSIGQEGNEYANLSEMEDNDDSSPTQTKNVAGDLPLHAPTASFPVSTAKARIATVTRTDSSQAAAAGIGNALDAEDRDKSQARSSSRPQSIYKDDDHDGIPMIGVQVPMYPNAGDVQAPTPGPYVGEKTGIGFFNNSSQQSLRNHHRSKSGRDVFTGPPGSYGLHGHGQKPKNEFERKWYEKHPQDAAKEAQGEYGPAIADNRKEWALSREDLNRLVHESGSKGAGLGASPDIVGTPDEQIGYMASEEFASRITSPRPPSAKPQSIKPRASNSQMHVDSPLRQQSEPETQDLDTVEATDDTTIRDADDNIIHVDLPSRHHKLTKVRSSGASAHEVSLEDEQSDAEGEDERRDYPILASDERAKRPEAEYLQPAISPELERTRSHDYYGNELDRERKSSSRASNRPGSAHGGMPGLTRFISNEDDRAGTPLDDVREYEPLFPDDEGQKKTGEKKPITATDKLKRPEIARHHFPSQDVWEDTPDSSQLVTEVDSEQVVDDAEGGVQQQEQREKPSQVFEKPEAEAARKSELTEKDQESFLSDHTKRFAKSHIRPDVAADMQRPGLRQRFPSQDVWEDTPEHLQLVTTVDSPQPEDSTGARKDETSSPTEDKNASSSQTSIKQSSPTDKKAPVIPDRPKPQIPARPPRLGQKDAAEGAGEPAGTTAKPKPAVPARPLGGKIAALQAGFMSDLNNRLQLGPRAPKPQEPAKEEVVEEEKAPLVDARKGRAKGPQRRKPATTASGAEETAAQKPSKPTFSTSVVSVWKIGEDNELSVHGSEKRTAAKPVAKTETADITTESVPPKTELTTAGEDASLAGKPMDGDEAKASQPAKAAEPPIETGEASVQTGRQDVSIQSGDNANDEKLTVFLGGRAPEPGNVVVDQDGVERIGDAPNTAGTKAAEF